MRDIGRRRALTGQLFPPGFYSRQQKNMRVGLLSRGEAAEFEWVRRLGFRSAGWIRFDTSACAQPGADWQRAAEETAEAAALEGLRISSIGALYRNPLDPAQREQADFMFRRAIQVAAHIGIRTVCGFPGAVIRTRIHPRGGNPVYEPFENHIPELLDFWAPLARVAADHGVRIGFEHCPQGVWHLPVMGYNMMGQPAIWERVFSESRSENLGLEWDASHLVCQFIDPVANILKFGRRIYHVHAKDAWVNRPLLETYGPCHPGVTEHRFPGLGQSNWAQIVHALLRMGYDSDLTVEGWHDPVYRDHDRELPSDDTSLITGLQKGQKLEEAGLRIALNTLLPLVEGTEAPANGG